MRDPKQTCSRHDQPLHGQPCPRCEEERQHRRTVQNAQNTRDSSGDPRRLTIAPPARVAARAPISLEEELERFRFSLEQARSCMEVGRYREGERQLRKALDIMPASSEPYELLVDLYQEWGNPRAEAEALETLCRLAPTHGRLLRLARLQPPERARDIYDRLLSQTPRDAGLAIEAAADRLRISAAFAPDALDILIGTGMEEAEIGDILDRIRSAPGLSGEAIAALDQSWWEMLENCRSFEEERRRAEEIAEAPLRLQQEEELRHQEERRRDEERSRQLSEHRRQKDESRRVSLHTRRRLGAVALAVLALSLIIGGISLLPAPTPSWQKGITAPPRPGIPVQARISPDRQRAAIAYAPSPGSNGESASLNLFRLSDGVLLSSLPLAAPPRQFLFSPDGRYLIALASPRELLLIEGATARRVTPGCDVQTMRAETERLQVVCLQNTAEGPRFEMQIWRLPSMEVLQTVHLPDAYDYTAITAMGMILREQRSTASPPTRYSLWSPHTAREALAGSGDESSAALISDNGLTLLLLPSMEPPMVRRVMEQTTLPLNTLAMNPPLEADISGDGRLIALAAGRLIGIWNSDQPAPDTRFDALMPVLSLELDPDGQTLLVLEQGGGWETWVYR